MQCVTGHDGDGAFSRAGVGMGRWERGVVGTALVALALVVSGLLAPLQWLVLAAPASSAAIDHAIGAAPMVLPTPAFPTPTPIPATPIPSPTPIPATPTPAIRYDGLHVQGNQIVDVSGIPVFLVGMAISGPEYQCNALALPQVQAAQFGLMRGWGVNTVRIPLSAPFWLNSGGVCPGYRAAIQTIVQRAETVGMYVMLTLQWSAPLPTANPAGAQFPLPGRAEALAFWSSVAAAYANDPRALFELYSEPHDLTWAQWRDGGPITDPLTQAGVVPGTYDAAGMQAMADAVSAAAPQRVILAGGLNWASDLSGVADGGGLHGANIAYAIHLYGAYGPTDPAALAADIARVTPGAPVVATEFGQLDCGTDLIEPLMPALRTLTQGLVAWTWDVGDCGRPGILANWDGVATPYGAAIRAFFQRQR